MKNKIIKLVAFCMVAILMIFLPGLFNLGFEVYLDVTMKITGKLPTVDTYEKLEKLVGTSIIEYNVVSRPSSIYTPDVAIGTLDASFSESSIGVDSLNNNINGYFSTSTTSSDYSTTNVQVAGVDEADILKNDDKYIYVIAKNKLVIIEAFPAKTMKKIAEIEIDEGYRTIDLYISKNRLILITDNYNSKYYRYSNIETKINIYDISDRSNPEIINTFEFTGSYSSSRKVGEKVYIFSNMSVNKDNGTYILPKYKEYGKGFFNEVSLKDVQYIPNDKYTHFTQIFTFDLANSLELPNIVTYLGSASRNVYMSKNNLYMAQNRGNETVIYKFDLDNECPRFTAKGTVPGSIINQFAMDEYDGNFRIATNNNGANAVYTLSESMHRLGSASNIARDETIKSVRFEGNRCYLVTFRNTDPLFVIDLSNAMSPKVLGELKIPGYSTYLHPYDESHVIGFGYDGTEGGTNGKLKLALFDITDVNNPKEKFKEVINASNSELLDNHKSLLFSKERELIAFSVGNYWDSKVGKVYNINLEDGIVLRGEINHESDVNRMLYMDDILYGVSETSVSAHNIDTIKELKRVDI